MAGRIELGSFLPHAGQWLYANELEAVTSLRTKFKPSPDQVLGGDYIREVQFPEVMAQAGGAALFMVAEGNLPLFAGISSAGFNRRVGADEDIIVETTLLGSKGANVNGKGLARVGEEVVASADFSVLSVPQSFFDKLIRRTEYIQADMERDLHNPELPVLGRDVMQGRTVWLTGVSESSESSGKGIWIPSEEEVEGHVFGGHYIVPGITQLGSMEDLTRYCLGGGEHLRLSSVSDVKFARIVRTGEALEPEVKIRAVEDGKYIVDGKALVAGAVACSAELIFRPVAPYDAADGSSI